MIYLCRSVKSLFHISYRPNYIVICYIFITASYVCPTMEPILDFVYLALADGKPKKKANQYKVNGA